MRHLFLLMTCSGNLDCPYLVPLTNLRFPSVPWRTTSFCSLKDCLILFNEGPPHSVPRRTVPTVHSLFRTFVTFFAFFSKITPPLSSDIYLMFRMHTAVPFRYWIMTPFFSLQLTFLFRRSSFHLGKGYFCHDNSWSYPSKTYSITWRDCHYLTIVTLTQVFKTFPLTCVLPRAPFLPPTMKL